MAARALDAFDANPSRADRESHGRAQVNSELQSALSAFWVELRAVLAAMRQQETRSPAHAQHC